MKNEPPILDLEAGGFQVKHAETHYVDVMEVSSYEELIQWAQAFGLSKLLQGQPPKLQAAWKHALVTAGESCRTHVGTIRLGGFCRLVLANQS